jgi:hypothetical protein
MAAATSGVAASGRVGFYGIVERVVFEPSEQAPERVQVWGAFAYADSGSTGAASEARRGYLYFRVPPAGPSSREAALAEWKDLKSVAGTGQAVAFGQWGYIGTFQRLDPASSPSSPSVILEMYPGRGERTDLRVRPAGAPPASPAAYMTDTGVVRLSVDGSRAEIVRMLQAVLAAP